MHQHITEWCSPCRLAVDKAKRRLKSSITSTRNIERLVAENALNCLLTTLDADARRDKARQSIKLRLSIYFVWNLVTRQICVGFTVNTALGKHAVCSCEFMGLLKCPDGDTTRDDHTIT